MPVFVTVCRLCYCLIIVACITARTLPLAVAVRTAAIQPFIQLYILIGYRQVLQKTCKLVHAYHILFHFSFAYVAIFFIFHINSMRMILKFIRGFLGFLL